MIQFLFKEEDLQLSSGFYILYFYTSWMPGHKRMQTILQGIDKQYENIVIYAIDVELHKNIKTRFNIQSVPVLLFIFKNEDVGRVNGLALSSAINSKVREIYTECKTLSQT